MKATHQFNKAIQETHLLKRMTEDELKNAPDAIQILYDIAKNEEKAETHFIQHCLEIYPEFFYQYHF